MWPSMVWRVSHFWDTIQQPVLVEHDYFVTGRNGVYARRTPVGM